MKRLTKHTAHINDEKEPQKHNPSKLWVKMCVCPWMTRDFNRTH